MKSNQLGLLLSLVIAGGALAGRASEAATVSLHDAISAAVENNLTSRLAVADSDAARAKVVQAAAALLPDLSGTAGQSRVFRQNLAAEGITFGASPLIGPYNSFDARFHLTQTLFDYSASSAPYHVNPGGTTFSVPTGGTLISGSVPRFATTKMFALQISGTSANLPAMMSVQGGTNTTYLRPVRSLIYNG